MANLHEQLLTAVAESNLVEAERLIRSGVDLNVRCDQGASLLYAGSLSGDVTLVRLMLEHGADPNILADEPAASVYTEKPLELAMQARFLMHWDKYHPIVRLLEEFGATDVDGRVESESDFGERERRAREWQSSRAAR
jgi:hypothetical protein